MLAESTLSPQGAVLLGAIQICVIVITHDLEIAAQMDEVWMMRDGVLEREESFQLVAGKSADFSAAFFITREGEPHKLDCKIFFLGGITMSEHCQDALQCRPEDLRSALSIHTRKITDSCRDKDCIEDLRVFLTRESQAALDTAASAKVRCAELLYTGVEVSPVAFNRNHYYIDLTFYYKIIADAMITACRPAALCGLATFSKRAVLCGENSPAHIFRSDTPGAFCTGAAPTAVVEVLDPMVLSSRVVPVCAQEPCTLQIPQGVRDSFDDELVLGGDRQRLFVTLGQFSIIHLERDAQLVVPILDYAIPTKECCDSAGCCPEDPCEIFSRIPFPASQFTPTGCREEGQNVPACYQTSGD